MEASYKVEDDSKAAIPNTSFNGLGTNCRNSFLSELIMRKPSSS